MTIDELTMLFDDVTMIDRDIASAKTARMAIQSMSQTHYMDAEHGRNSCDCAHVKAWIDHNIDQLVLQKCDTQLRIKNAVFDA